MADDYIRTLIHCYPPKMIMSLSMFRGMIFAVKTQTDNITRSNQGRARGDVHSNSKAWHGMVLKEVSWIPMLAS